MHRPVILPTLFAALLVLAGCGGIAFEEVEYQEPDAMAPGPGLFSGEDGAFTLIDEDLGRDRPGDGEKKE